MLLNVSHRAHLLNISFLILDFLVRTDSIQGNFLCWCHKGLNGCCVLTHALRILCSICCISCFMGGDCLHLLGIHDLIALLRNPFNGFAICCIVMSLDLLFGCLLLLNVSHQTHLLNISFFILGFLVRADSIQGNFLCWCHEGFNGCCVLTHALRILCSICSICCFVGGDCLHLLCIQDLIALLRNPFDCFAISCIVTSLDLFLGCLMLLNVSHRAHLLNISFLILDFLVRTDSIQGNFLCWCHKGLNGCCVLTHALRILCSICCISCFIGGDCLHLLGIHDLIALLRNPFDCFAICCIVMSLDLFLGCLMLLNVSHQAHLLNISFLILDFLGKFDGIQGSFLCWHTGTFNRCGILTDLYPFLLCVLSICLFLGRDILHLLSILELPSLLIMRSSERSIQVCIFQLFLGTRLFDLGCVSCCHFDGFAIGQGVTGLKLLTFRLVKLHICNCPHVHCIFLDMLR